MQRTLSRIGALAIAGALAACGGGGSDAVPEDTTPPAIPQNLVATPGNGQVTLEWDAVEDADLDHYMVYGGPTDGVRAAINFTSSTTFTVDGINNYLGYTFTVTAVDQKGNESAPATEVEATPMPPDVTAPTLVTTSPSSGAADQPLAVNIVFTFSEAMNEASVESAFSIFPAFPSGGACVWSVSGEGRVFACDPTVELEYATSYALTISTVAEDLAGNHMLAADVRGFRTADVADDTAPTVYSRSPAEGATGVLPESSIAVTFNEPMLAQGLFQITSPAGVAGSATWSPDQRTFTFDPTGNLPYDTTISYQITLAADLAGNSAGTVTGSFKVAVRETVTRSSEIFLDGFLLSNGTVDTSATYIRFGDDPLDRQIKGFISFTNNLTNPIRIDAAVLTVNQYSCTGTPYADLDEAVSAGATHDLMAAAVDLDAALDATDFDSAPLSWAGGDERYELIPDERNAAVNLAVTGTVSRNVFDRTLARSQWRLEFPVTSDDDGAGDYCQIYSGDATSDRPTLTITYLRP